MNKEDIKEKVVNFLLNNNYEINGKETDKDILKMLSDIVYNEKGNLDYYDLLNSKKMIDSTETYLKLVLASSNNLYKANYYKNEYKKSMKEEKQEIFKRKVITFFKK